MQINERIVADLTILDVSGELTSGDGAQRLQNKIESLIFQKRTHVILNLAEVPYIDSGAPLANVLCIATMV
jgi:anti-anti-sigma factor